MFTRYLLLVARILDGKFVSPLRRAADIITDDNPDQPRGQPDNAGQFVKAGSTSYEYKEIRKIINRAKPADKTRAPQWFIKSNKPLLLSCYIAGLGRVSSVRDHVFDCMYERGISAEEVKSVLAQTNRTIDAKYGGYIYSFGGLEVCVTVNRRLKTVINTNVGDFKSTIGDALLEAFNARRTKKGTH